MSDDQSQPADASTSQRTREAAEESKALGSLTDHVEDRELDTSKVSQAMSEIKSSQKASLEAKRQREKELASVKVSAADIDLILTEIEVDHKAADRRLREHGGNIHLALKSFL